MSKAMYKLVIGVAGGVAAIASAVVAYAQPENTPAIIAAVGIANTAVAEICALFVIEDLPNG